VARANDNDFVLDSQFKYAAQLITLAVECGERAQPASVRYALGSLLSECLSVGVRDLMHHLPFEAGAEDFRYICEIQVKLRSLPLAVLIIFS
jgi:hypothetical protein